MSIWLCFSNERMDECGEEGVIWGFGTALPVAVGRVNVEERGCAEC